MFHQIEDTIAAISCAPGAGGRGLLRLSGPRSAELADAVFACADGMKLQDVQSRRRIMGRLRVAGSTVPAEAYVFLAPASYTRQDVIELHTVGSPPLLSIVLDALLASGARAAEPGEFTARAFFNGALDLTRVEGVASAIAARSDAQLRASRHLLLGGLGRRMSGIREALGDMLALVEAEIDFVEESMGFVTSAEADARISDALLALRETLDASTSLERLELLPEVVLTGRPNAGKSTLFNRLTGTDRAIRSAVAGTTRDLLRAPVNLAGGEIILVDSAGVSDVPRGAECEAHGPDALAEAAALRAIETADFILCVVDISQAPEPAQVLSSMRLHRPGLVVGNKSDLVSPSARAQWEDHAAKRAAEPFTADVVLASAVTGEGIELLRENLGARLFSGVPHRAAEAVGLTARQYQALRNAASALSRAQALLRHATDLGACAELVAVELREAISALSLLTGEMTTEDLLGRIFSRFCIGK